MDLLQILFICSIIITCVGVFLLMIGGGIFQFRAITNKKAWEGKTKPFLKLGLVVFIPGLIGLIITAYQLVK